MNRQGSLAIRQNPLEYLIAVFATAILYLTLLAGAYLGYEVLLAPDKGALEWRAVLAGALVVALGFVLSVGVISYGIVKKQIALLNYVVLIAAVVVAGGMLIVHGKMSAKALGQQYGMGKFVLHSALLLTTAAIVTFLEHIRSAEHPPVFFGEKEGGMSYVYAGVLLFQEAIHFFGMIMCYVLQRPEEPAHVLYDLLIFVFAFLISLALIGRFGRVINFFAYKLTKTIQEV